MRKRITRVICLVNLDIVFHLIKNQQLLMRNKDLITYQKLRTKIALFNLTIMGQFWILLSFYSFLCITPSLIHY